jgi:predicted phage terminase large subunit-like protein
LEGDWSEYSGGFFRREWFTVVDSPPEPERRVRCWDLAATEARAGKDPDWSAGVLLGRTKDKQYVVVDVRRIRATPLAVQALVRRCAEQDGRGVGVYMEQEPGSAGATVIDHFARSVLPGWPFHGVRSTGNKRERAAPFSSMAEAGNIKLLRAPWNGVFLDELASFPQGAHDDQVDAASLAFAQLAAKRKFWIGYDTLSERCQAEPKLVKAQRPNGDVVWTTPDRVVDVRPDAPGWQRWK